MESLAFGREDSALELTFHERDTWLGSLEGAYRPEMAEEGDEHRVMVRVQPLDAFVSERRIKPDLIKIDTEGFELQVLEGAESTLREQRPIVIFECREPEPRTLLFDFLKSHGYLVSVLPLLPGQPPQTLTRTDFSGAKGSNFCALPSELDLQSSAL